MDERTLEALRASIKHWEEIVALDDDAIRNPPIGSDKCALCALFNTEEAFSATGLCKGCPIDAAGFHGCEGSPYDEVGNAVLDRHDPGVIRVAARAELRFLRSLLPSAEEATRHG